MSHHESTTAVIRCGDDNYMDGRKLHAVYKMILEKENVDEKDIFPIFILGAAIDFLVDPNSRIVKRMTALPELGVKKVVLIEHTPECGAYKNEFGVLSETAEKDLHLKTIALVQKFFTKYLPSIELVCYLQVGDDQYEKID